MELGEKVDITIIIDNLCLFYLLALLLNSRFQAVDCNI